MSENNRFHSIKDGVTTSQWMECPECGSQIPVDPEFITWCDRCGWGMAGTDVPQKLSRLERLYKMLGEKQSSAVFNQLQTQKNFRPTWNWSLFLVFFLSVVIHLISLAVCSLGVLIVVRYWSTPFLAVVGFALLGLSWLLRPKPVPKPKETPLDRNEFREFYALVNQIAFPLGTHVDRIVVNSWFSAGFTKVGWLQKNTLIIGLPLWEILTAQEKIALIAHEMAHAVNGDLSKSWFIGSAIRSLQTWYEVIAPGPVVDDVTNFISILGFPLRILGNLIAAIIWGLTWLMSVLLFREMQVAEYRADQLGASIVGGEVLIRTLRKLFYQDAFMLAVQRCALSRGKTDLFTELQHLIASTSPRELDRLNRLEERNGKSLGTTHPPTGLRIKRLQQQSWAPSMIIQEASIKIIDQKLASFRSIIQQQLVDQYHAAITG